MLVVFLFIFCGGHKNTVRLEFRSSFKGILGDKLSGEGHFFMFNDICIHKAT